MPSIAANEVINTGRNRRRPERSNASRKRVARGEMIFNRVEHQDPVLGDDADDHDHSHQRNHIERRAGNEQRQQHAATTPARRRSRSRSDAQTIETRSVE